MFGVIATSLLEAARTSGFAQVPRNEDWRLIEARQREAASSEERLSATVPKTSDSGAFGSAATGSLQPLSRAAWRLW